MNEETPYTPPQAEILAPTTEQDTLSTLDFPTLKKHYHRSCNVNAITSLLGLGGVLFTASSFAENDSVDTIGMITLGVLLLVSMVGLYKRTYWSKIVGIILCFTFLLGFPLGTVIGIFGLFAFFGSPELFGKGRFTHKELKSEFKRHKKLSK